MHIFVQFGDDDTSIGRGSFSFFELIDSAAAHERITVTRHGRAVAVLLAVEDYESMLETIDVLSTPGAADEIRSGLADLSAGRTSDWQDLRREFARPGDALSAAPSAD